VIEIHSHGDTVGLAEVFGRFQLFAPFHHSAISRP
jgi:hypothetical protein